MSSQQNPGFNWFHLSPLLHLQTPCCLLLPLHITLLTPDASTRINPANSAGVWSLVISNALSCTQQARLPHPSPCNTFLPPPLPRQCPSPHPTYP